MNNLDHLRCLFKLEYLLLSYKEFIKITPRWWTLVQKVLKHEIIFHKSGTLMLEKISRSRMLIQKQTALLSMHGSSRTFYNGLLSLTIVVFYLQDLTVVLSTLLPVVIIDNDMKQQEKFSVGLKV